MQINLMQYVNLLQGLCYLNFYIGFEIDIRCFSELSTGEGCAVNYILPTRIHFKQNPRHCKSIAEAQSIVVPLQETELGCCVIYYCRNRLKRSSDNETGNSVDTDRDSQNKTRNNTFVKSYAFGNPSLPQRPPRKRKRKPPRTKPKQSG